LGKEGLKQISLLSFSLIRFMVVIWARAAFLYLDWVWVSLGKVDFMYFERVQSLPQVI
ncbi:unnamed protein product, partial [Prunus brigantina]